MTGPLFEVSMLFLIQTCFLTSQVASKSQQFVKFAGNGHVFKSVPESTDRMVLCARACMKAQPICIGINFNKEKKQCELLDRVVPASTPLENSNTTWVTGKKVFIIFPRLFLDWFPRPELTSKLTGPALGSHYPQCTTRMTLFLSR